MTQRLMALIAVSVLALYGCGGGSSSSPPTPAATVTISISPSAVTVGGSTTVTWSSANATSCAAGGAWSGAQATSGTATIKATTAGLQSVSLTCTGPGGSGTQAAPLTVASPLAVAALNFPPAPIETNSAGDCVSYTTADVVSTCIVTPGTVPPGFGELQNAPLSYQVVLNGTSAPTVTAGGTCSGGIDADGNFSLDASSFSGGSISLPLSTSLAAGFNYTTYFLNKITSVQIAGFSSVEYESKANVNDVGIMENIILADGTAGTIVLAGNVIPGPPSNPNQATGTLYMCLAPADVAKYIPDAPTNVTVSSSATTVTLSWTPSTDAGGPGIGGYKIIRGGTTEPIATLPANAIGFTDTALQPDSGQLRNRRIRHHPAHAAHLSGSTDQCDDAGRTGQPHQPDRTGQLNGNRDFFDECAADMEGIGR